MIDYNPIQMGSDFTSFHMLEIENEVRSMVDELQYRYGHGEVPQSALESEMYYRHINYNTLPFSCMHMIDELELY